MVEIAEKSTVLQILNCAKENQIHVMNYCFPGIEKIEFLFINSD